MVVADFGALAFAGALRSANRIEDFAMKKPSRPAKKADPDLENASDKPRKKKQASDGTAVAKEDVVVKNPGKQPRPARHEKAKSPEKAGDRLMDYTG